MIFLSPFKICMYVCIYLFMTEGKGGRKTSMCGCLSHAPTGDLAHNPGMCPDRESNQWLLGSQAGTQSTPARAESTLLDVCWHLSFRTVLPSTYCISIAIPTDNRVLVRKASCCSGNWVGSECIEPLNIPAIPLTNEVVLGMLLSPSLKNGDNQNIFACQVVAYV